MTDGHENEAQSPCKNLQGRPICSPQISISRACETKLGCVLSFLENAITPSKMAAAEIFRLHFLNNRSSIQSFFEISASNTNIATSQARHLHQFQSQGNFWNRLTNALCSWKKSVRNFGNITCEFQTVGYLVFLKPYPVAGCVDTGYQNV